MTLGGPHRSRVWSPTCEPSAITPGKPDERERQRRLEPLTQARCTPDVGDGSGLDLACFAGAVEEGVAEGLSPPLRGGSTETEVAAHSTGNQGAPVPGAASASHRPVPRRARRPTPARRLRFGSHPWPRLAGQSALPCDEMCTVTTAPEARGTQFPGWSKQIDPDPASVAALYRDGRTEREIACILGVSRRRVANALSVAGAERRPAARACPVDDAELHRLYHDEQLTQAQLAERLDAAPGTVARWLAECGIGTPDPRIDHQRLRQRYLDEQATTREIAAELGVSHNRVIRELALAGIPRRSRHDRRPTGPRAALTDERLAELYVERGLTIRELTVMFGVSDEYLRKRLRQCGLAKRPGSFQRSCPGTAENSPPMPPSCTPKQA